jgi:hypothetical protein
MLGPAEGSFFYGIGGYPLPFYVNTGVILLTTPLIFKFIPTNKEIIEFQE